MNTLPTEIKILKSIKKILDSLMADNGTRLEIRANELYEHVIKESDLRNTFRYAADFNRFLRQQHDKGFMKQIIPNYRVDTFNKSQYQWYFHRQSKSSSSSTKGVMAETLESNYNYFKQNKIVKCRNGEYVNSGQEKLIYEQLLNCKELTIRHDHPLTHNQETKFADFFIINNNKKTTFYWEHFGKTNDENYKDEISEKLEWYYLNGYSTTDKGGNLIITYFSSESSLQKDIEYYLNLILTASKNC